MPSWFPCEWCGSGVNPKRQDAEVWRVKDLGSYNPETDQAVAEKIIHIWHRQCFEAAKSR